MLCFTCMNVWLRIYRKPFRSLKAIELRNFGKQMVLALLCLIK